MNVVVIRHSIRNRGGDRLILDYLSFLVSKGHHVIYWTNEINTSFHVEPKIQIRRIFFPGVIGTVIFTLFTKFRSDVVLVDLVVMSLFASVLNQGRVVYLAQDDDRTYYSLPLMRGFIELVFRVVFIFFKVKVIAVSEYLTGQLQKFSRQKIETISNGIDQRIFHREDQSRFLVEKTTSMAVVLYARADFRKGLDVGIKSVEELARLKGINGWELWIIGGGHVTVSVDGLKIKRWGFLKDDDLRAVFSAADIYLLPSRHEGLSLLLLAALACGCVVVGTKAANILTNEQDGLICAVEDWRILASNISRLMDDKGLFEKLKNGGQKLSERYSFRESCEQFEKEILLVANQQLPKRY